MLDLGNIPLHAINRTLGDPLVVAGGPCTQNPEPIAPFIDIAVTGDGEPSLPEICDRWLQRKEEMTSTQGILTGPAGQKQREQILRLIQVHGEEVLYLLEITFPLIQGHISIIMHILHHYLTHFHHHLHMTIPKVFHLQVLL